MTAPEAETPVSWHAEVRPCPACGSDDYRILGRRGGRAHRGGLGVETGLVRCRECHLVYPRPALIPTGNPYLAYSADSYFHGRDPASKERIGTVLAMRAESILGRKGRLLELGCGRGELLRGAARAGWSVRGVDMTPGFAGTESGIEIEVGPVETATSLRDTYDVIVLAAILEHLYEPAVCLRRVHGALVEGGLVFIDVPNECGLFTRVANLYQRLRFRDWVVNLSPTFPPFHVVGFCPRSLKRILHESGFSVVEMVTHRWQNELPKLGAWSTVESLACDATLSVGCWVGMGAGITCWARKAATNHRGEPGKERSDA
jgi:SAM-dependent methyltransferase